MDATDETDVFSKRAPSRTSSLADFGLLILRLATGATMVQAGLIKAFDLHTTVNFMEDSGWRMPQFAALMVTIAETAGGIALILGLLTPVAACAVLAAMIDAWAATVSGDAFWSMPFNVPFMVGFAATALLFTGAGTLSLDAKLFRRAQWPAFVAIVLFIVAIAAAVATWVLLNGSNPLHMSDPTP
jgi:putative oxidoreductase